MPQPPSTPSVWTTVSTPAQFARATRAFGFVPVLASLAPTSFLLQCTSSSCLFYTRSDAFYPGLASWRPTACRVWGMGVLQYPLLTPPLPHFRAADADTSASLHLDLFQKRKRVWEEKWLICCMH